MIFTPASLPGSYIVEPTSIGDSRGWFARTFCKREFATIGHDKEWVQLNHSYTAEVGSVRGMHFQRDPHQEIKLVRCIAGAVFDVIIDLRKDSPSFLQWMGFELSAANKKMLYIPEGFAHGFQVLAPDTELIYHHTAYYTPDAEAAVRFNDPAINIKWPLQVAEVSSRDQQHPLIDSNFKAL